MRAIDRKLVRDLWRLRGQVIAIALVIASGVGVLVMSLSSIEALSETAAAYYERYRFAQVFAGVKRAPERLAKRIADIPGVQAVETRVAKFAVLDVAGFARDAVFEPAMHAGQSSTPGIVSQRRPACGTRKLGRWTNVG